MIKLKKLIPENTSYEEFVDVQYMIIGTVTQDNIVKSTKTSEEWANHRDFGYAGGSNWRYNPITQTVYWWFFDKISEVKQADVKTHLKLKYNEDVIDDKSMMISKDDVPDGDVDAENDWRQDQNQRDDETHPGFYT